MADTIISYKRGSQGSDQIARTRVPGEGGIRALYSAEREYIAGIDAFAKAGGKFADAYFTAIENREVRDADTTASKLFRDRRIEILQTTKGKDADGLLDREIEWSNQQFEPFAEAHNISTVKAKEIWRKHSDTYLDRTGAYMIEQQNNYDKQSRMASSNAALDDLVSTSIGDIGAIEVVFSKNDELFVNEPAVADTQNDKAVMVAVGAWARQNPQATIKWFNENKESLKQRFGSKFINVADVIDKAENKIQAEARHTEVLAQRAERLERQRKADYSEKVFNDFISLAARGEADASALYAITDDPNVSSSDKIQAVNFVKGLESAYNSRRNAEVKAEQDALEAGLVSRAYTDDPVQIRQLAIRAVQEGKLTTEAFNNIMRNISSATSIPDSVKPFISDVRATLKNSYANVPTGFIQDPASLDQYNRLSNAVTARAHEHPESVAKDFNLNDPNSWINQLLRDNPPIPRSMTVKFGETFDPSTPYTIKSTTGTTPATGTTSATGTTPPTSNKILEGLKNKGFTPRGQ